MQRELPPEVLLSGFQLLLVLEGCDELHVAGVEEFGTYLESLMREHGAILLAPHYVVLK